MNAPLPDEIAGLKAQLDEAARREARHRLESAEDHLALSARLQQANRTIGDRGEQIQRLHLEQQARDAELHAARDDLEALVWMLQESERARDRAERRTFSGFFRALLDPRPARPVRMPPGDFVYHLAPSPFRIYRETAFTLRGWVFPRDGRAVTGVRVRLDDREFIGQYGRPAPEAAIQHGPQPRNPQPGFEVAFDTPPGRHRLALEVRLEDGAWLSMLEVPVWCRPKT